MDFLNQSMKNAMQQAYEVALIEKSLQVEIAHVLGVLLEQKNCLKKLSISPNDLLRAKNELDRILKDLPKMTEGHENHQPQISPGLQRIIAFSKNLAKKFNKKHVGEEIFLLAISQDGGLESKKILSLLNVKDSDLQKILSDANGVSEDSALHLYTQNLSQQARDGKLDPVIGRDEEIRRTIHILQRRRKNNPVLIGEPGVGKTAIVEGLAQKIINKEVPDSLIEKEILVLDMGALVAGAKYRGEFEERLKNLLNEIEEHPDQYIVFIDEMHTLVGAGKSDGAMDAANLLKPMLARGILRCIGATTLKEYKYYIEKDMALERRFEKIIITEPSISETLAILRGLKSKYEVHHGVKILDEALSASAELSSRYISDRNLPDKAIDLLDEAAASLRMSIDSMPEALEKMHSQILHLQVEKQALLMEAGTYKDRLEDIEQTLLNLHQEYSDLHAIWQEEKNALFGQARFKKKMEELKEQFEKAKREGNLGLMSKIQYGDIPDLEKMMQKIAVTENRKFRLLKEEVNAEDIAKVISKSTGIPLAKMMLEEKKRLLSLEQTLKENISGQDDVITRVSQTILRSKAGLHRESRPLASFLFLGKTGVGKTELSKELAKFLFASSDCMIRFDMSEFMEKHSVSRLIGAPPGYIGYEEGGFLTEKVRRSPYSVILFDEIEKAHPDVLSILLQVLDAGRLTDSQGRTVSFEQCLIVMTSNIGSEIIPYQQKINPEIYRKMHQLLLSHLKPELINRIDEIAIFNPLDRSDVEKIVIQHMKKLTEHLNKLGYNLICAPAVYALLAEKGFDAEYGARPLKRAIAKYIENPLSIYLLSQHEENRPNQNAQIMLKADISDEDQVVIQPIATE